MNIKIQATGSQIKGGDMDNENDEHKYPMRQETFKIIGICMEIHRILGKGFLEIVYKDACEYEFKQKDIIYAREVEYGVNYKDVILPHRFFADFVVFDDIILEIKAQKELPQEFDHQVLNYLTVSKCKIGLLVNFGLDSLKFRRLII